MINAFDELNGKVVAITGASGYIGSALSNALTKHDVEILSVSRQEIVSRTGDKSIKADVRTPDCWIELVEQADVIFHLAGNTSVYAAAKNPVDSLNSTVLPITHLVSAVKKVNRKPRVVFASTATLYGLNEQFPITESTEPEPITVYDLHKYFAEQQLALASNHGLLESVSLRLANVYGPSANDCSATDRGILNKVTTVAMQGKDLTIYGDGNYLRDYVYIDDVVNAFLLAGQAPGIQARSFIVASGVSNTLKEAFELVTEQAAIVTGKKVHLNYAAWPAGADAIEYRNFKASNDGLVSATGWQPTITLEEGVKLLIAEYMKK